MKPRPDWSRDETILALDLYQKHWPISGEDDPRVQELSSLLRSVQADVSSSDPKFRNPAGVYRKLTNLVSVDPSNAASGSPHASAMDRTVLGELGARPDRVAALAADIRARWQELTQPASINLRRIWITGMWGFDPSRWGFLGFSDARIRDRFLKDYEPDDLVLVVGQNSAMAAEADVGRLLGFMRITKAEIEDFERMPADEYERKVRLYGKERWGFAMPANAAWRIGTEVRVKHVLPKTYSGRWPILIGARYRQVDPSEQEKLKDLRLLPTPVFGEKAWNESLVEAPTSAPLRALVSRGPVPKFGNYITEIRDSVGWLYIVRLEGADQVNFAPPDGAPLGQRQVFKVGWCVDVKKRLKVLNSGFPKGMRVRWRRYDARAFASRDEAYKVEQEIFAWVNAQDISLGGEFIIGGFEAVASIQARWFSQSAGRIGS